MRSFPEIETSRLKLRQLQLSDAGALFHYFSKDEVTVYYDLESFTNIVQAEELIQKWDSRFHSEQAIRWGITYKDQDRVIGSIGFHNWKKDHFRAEVGYELTPEHWLKGIMTEALGAILKFGFNDLELNRIEAFIDPDNTGSRKLLEKTGFREEGLLKDYFYEKNRFVNAVIFAALQKEQVS